MRAESASRVLHNGVWLHCFDVARIFLKFAPRSYAGSICSAGHFKISKLEVQKRARCCSAISTRSVCAAMRADKRAALPVAH